jgi:hypothetical protein
MHVASTSNSTRAIQVKQKNNKYWNKPREGLIHIIICYLVDRHFPVTLAHLDGIIDSAKCVGRVRNLKLVYGEH